MDKKSPFEAVIEEMSLTSELTPEQLRVSLRGVMDHLRERAQVAVEDDQVDDDVALEYAHQFLAYTQLVHFYGTALIAFDDIEEDEIGAVVSVDDEDLPN